MTTVLAKLIRPLACAGLALVPLIVLGCGGAKGTIEIKVVTNPLDDPFKSATEVLFTVGTKTKTVPVIDGHFEFSLDQEPPKTPGPITIRALDAAGNTVGYGTTPTLSLQAVDQGPFYVWVGRPGTVGATGIAKLPSPRAEMAAFGATGLGVMFAGGRDASGPLKSSAVYNVFTHTAIIVTDMSVARAGAVAIPTSPRGIVFGGAQAGGPGASEGALGSGELFDPSTGTGLWVAVPADSAPEPRAFPNLITLGSGSGLITGGASSSGAALSSALLVAAGGTARFTPLSAPMVAPRLRHCAAAARFADGDGAFVIGGLPDGNNGPVVERLLGQQFSSTGYDAQGVENRWDATATSVDAGVLVVGGTVDVGGKRSAVASMWLLSNDANTAPVRYDILTSARAGHTATKIGNELLICGGVDETGVAQASCEVIGINPVVWKSRIATGVARTGHVAVALETGPVLLAGGVGDAGQFLDSIELYTPAAPPQ